MHAHTAHNTLLYRGILASVHARPTPNKVCVCRILPRLPRLPRPRSRLGLPHSAHAAWASCRRCVWPRTSSWCDGRFASLGRVSPIRDEAESALMQWVAYQCRCEGRFAFSPPEAAECKILYLICTSSNRAAAARDPQPLASPGALGSFPSRTKSPETPSVAYKMVRMVPTPF